MPTWEMIKDGREKAKPTLVGRLIQLTQDVIGQVGVGPTGLLF